MKKFFTLLWMIPFICLGQKDSISTKVPMPQFNSKFKLNINTNHIDNIPKKEKTETAPIKVGDFELNKTTIKDIDNTLRKYGAEEIDKHFGQSGSLTEGLMVDENLDEPSEYRWSFHIDDSINDSTASLCAYSTMKNISCFFINQIKVGDYYINNLFLSFYKDTLVRFKYSSGADLLDVFSEKYKHKGSVIDKGSLKSKCPGYTKAGYSQLALVSNDTSMFSYLTVYLNADSKCNSLSYIKVESLVLDKNIIMRDIIAQEIKDRKIERERNRFIKRKAELNNF